MNTEIIPVEIYRLTLEHFIDLGCKRHRIDEPLVVQMIINSNIPTPIYLNQMLDMMRDQVLKSEWCKRLEKEKE